MTSFRGPDGSLLRPTTGPGLGGYIKTAQRRDLLHTEESESIDRVLAAALQHGSAAPGVGLRASGPAPETIIAGKPPSVSHQLAAQQGHNRVKLFE